MSDVLLESDDDAEIPPPPVPAVGSRCGKSHKAKLCKGPDKRIIPSAQLTMRQCRCTARDCFTQFRGSEAFIDEQRSQLHGLDMAAKELELTLLFIADPVVRTGQATAASAELFVDSSDSEGVHGDTDSDEPERERVAHRRSKVWEAMKCCDKWKTWALTARST